MFFHPKALVGPTVMFVVISIGGAMLFTWLLAVFQVTGWLSIMVAVLAAATVARLVTRCWYGIGRRKDNQTRNGFYSI